MYNREEKISLARKYAGRFISDPSINSVFIGGSLTAGLGSPTSDVDLFLITDKRASLRKTWQSIVEGCRVDVEVYEVWELKEALGKILPEEPGENTLLSVRSLKSEIDLMARLEHGIVLKQSKELEQIKQALLVNANQFYSLQANYWALIVEAVKEDFIGAILAEDYHTAAYLGQNLLSTAGKSFSSATGDSYFGEKWVYQQLVRSSLGGELFQRFATLQFGWWSERKREGALEVLYMAQDMVVAAQLQGVFSGERGCDLSAFFTSLKKREGETLYRHPLYGAFRVDGGVQVHWELHKDMVLSNRLACLLGICSGRSLSEIYRLVKKNACLRGALGDPNEERLVGMVEKLRDNGLVLASLSEVNDLIWL